VANFGEVKHLTSDHPHDVKSTFPGKSVIESHLGDDIAANFSHVFDFMSCIRISGIYFLGASKLLRQARCSNRHVPRQRSLSWRAKTAASDGYLRSSPGMASALNVQWSIRLDQR
jgi:hypothetical protein